jgi:hypothetical protein
MTAASGCPDMRVMFVAYLVVIGVGLVVLLALALRHA